MEVKTKVDRVLLGIYRHLYKESTPSANFDLLVQRAEATNSRDSQGRLEIPFDEYFLDKDRYEEIVDEHLKKSKLNTMEKKAVSFQAYLGCGPTSYKTNDFK